jgi:3-deoxy-D-manno-octulosonic-acid transferase
MPTNTKTPFFSFLYGLLISLYALVFMPRFFWKMSKAGLGLKPLLQRFGFGIPKNEKGIGAFWYHAVSLGETKAIAPLILEIQKQYPGVPTIITSTTDTGYKEAEKLFPKAIRFFLPLDFKWVLRPIVNFYLPKMIIFSETDLWYHLLQLGKNVHARTAVVSAKISERSQKRFLKYPALANKLFSQVDKILAQNETYLERYLTLGIPPSKLTVTGNLKYDVRYPAYTPEELQELRNRIGLQEGESLIVLASTHAPEEEWLIEKLSPLLATHPKWKVAVVPRHPHRFEEVAKLLPQPRCYSNPQETSSQWILVDTMGQLMKHFAIADVAVVCGSFKEIGGHNLLEPSVYKVPVLFGPHVFTQFEMEELLLKNKAGEKVILEELPSRITYLLEHPEERQAIGERGAALIASLQGIAKKTWQSLII